MAICKYCKNENPDGVTFCKNCGNTLEKDPFGSSSSGASAPMASAPAKAPEQIPYQAAEGPNSQHFEKANTVPFNEKDKREYEEKLRNPYKTDLENTCLFALIFGFVSLGFNPLCLNGLIAIILGVIGHINNGSKKSLAKLGWILGLISLIMQLIFIMMIGVLFLGVFTFLRYLF